MTRLATFATCDDAAIAALTQVVARSRSEDLEYGGLLYQAALTFGYTFARQGSSRGVRISDMIVPAGTVEVGCYHTHGDYVAMQPAGPRRPYRPVSYRLAPRRSEPARARR